MLPMLNYISNDKSVKKAFLLTLLCHIIAAFFSEGFHRPDEHLGVINMMAYKLGIVDQKTLSWEFQAQIRTWAQPYFYLSIAKVFNLFSNNPFYLAFILRLISSMIGLSSLVIFLKSCHSFFKEEKIYNLFQISIYLFWFFPFFHARTTTENFSTSFFLFAISILFKFYFNSDTNNQHEYSTTKVIKHGLISGVLFSLAFIFRFQTILAMAGPLLIILKKGKSGFIFFFTVATTMLLATMASSVIDQYGHGTWSFVPWNYIYHNIFLGVASGYGTSPWYFYFFKIFTETSPPLGAIIIIGVLGLLFKNPKHLTHLIIWPFFIVHCLISHKELRFIFTLLPIALLSTFCFLEFYRDFIFSKPIRPVVKYISYVVLFFNFSLLIISISKPAFSPIKMYKYIYYSNENIDKIYTLGVFRDQLRFYLKKPFLQIEVNLNQVEKLIEEKNNETTWILTDKLDQREKIISHNNCQEKFFSYPQWILGLDIKNLMRKSKMWSLIKCQ